jgi:transposase
MSELTKTLGNSYGNLEDLFEMRLKRTDGALGYDLTSASTNGRIKEWAEWGHNRDNERMKQMNVGLVTDRHGVPAMFELYPGSIADVRTLERTVERVRELKGTDCTLVMDRGFGSAANLKYMLENGMSFVIPGKKGTKCVKTLLSTLVKEKHNADDPIIHDRTTYSIYTSKVAVIMKKEVSDTDEDSNDTQEYELILPDDPRFADVPESMIMTAHACYDSRKAADDMNSVYQAVSDIEAWLKEMNPYSAIRDVKKVAGPYAKCFDLSIDDEGKLVVEKKRNALSFSMNRNGMFVMLSKGIGPWEDMMSCYGCRTYVEQAFDTLKNELDGNRWRVADPITAKGRLVIKFVALILWCTMSKMLREGGNDEPVRTALQSMDNILAVGCADEWKVLEITKRNRKLMEMFYVRQPEKRMVLKDRQYIPQAVIDEAYSD